MESAGQVKIFATDTLAPSVLCATAHMRRGTYTNWRAQEPPAAKLAVAQVGSYVFVGQSAS
jgi:hypothetical protein